MKRNEVLRSWIPEEEMRWRWSWIETGVQHKQLQRIWLSSLTSWSLIVI